MKDLRSLAQSLLSMPLAALSPTTPGSRQGLRRGWRPVPALATPNQLALAHQAPRQPARQPASQPARSPARTDAPLVYGPHVRRGPTSAPGPSSGPSARGGPQLGARSLARGWMRALTPDAWAAVHDAPHPVVARIVRWAPIVTPAVVGSLLLTLALMLVARAGYPPYAPLTPSQVIPALLLTYLVWGALQGLALYFAPNGVVWSLAFLGMPPLLLVALFSEAFGWPGGLFTLAALATAWLLYSGARRSQTPAGTVEVALLFGEWYRTLPHGYNVLLPGERVIVGLRVTPRSFTTALQRVSLGPDRIAQARATAAYVVQARDAWRTASVRATWEAELRQRISASVRESLSEWRVTPDGELAAHGSIAQRALDDTRAWARSVGVRILSVRAHDIAVGSPQRLASAPQSAPASPAPSTAAAAPRSARSATPPARPTPRIARTDAPAPTPTRATVSEPAPARALPQMRTPAPTHAEPPSPAALEDLYEAVRNRKITDSQVIREIASHFAALASAPPGVTGALPFDPTAAARLLVEYADALDVAQGVGRPARRVARSR